MPLSIVESFYILLLIQDNNDRRIMLAYGQVCVFIYMRQPDVISSQDIHFRNYKQTIWRVGSTIPHQKPSLPNQSSIEAGQNVEAVRSTHRLLSKVFVL